MLICVCDIFSWCIDFPHLDWRQCTINKSVSAAFLKLNTNLCNVCSNNITQEKPLDYIQYFILLIFTMMQEVDLLHVQVIILP